MRIISINAGRPRAVSWNGNSAERAPKEVLTGIFKSAVQGPVMLRRLNLDGDAQADLENHGGIAKAVYAYPSEHYTFWRGELPDTQLPWGAFGENLTTGGLREDETQIGDQFRLGGTDGPVIMATQPRIPCYKLGIRLGNGGIPAKFLRSNRSGIYFAVIREGLVGAGDSIERIRREGHGISVLDVNRLYARDEEHSGGDLCEGQNSQELLRRVVDLEALGPGLRAHFRKRLARL